jgi:hypothetical protein
MDDTSFCGAAIRSLRDLYSGSPVLAGHRRLAIVAHCIDELLMLSLVRSHPHPR